MFLNFGMLTVHIWFVPLSINVQLVTDAYVSPSGSVLLKLITSFLEPLQFCLLRGLVGICPFYAWFVSGLCNCSLFHILSFKMAWGYISFICLICFRPLLLHPVSWMRALYLLFAQLFCDFHGQKNWSVGFPFVCLLISILVILPFFMLLF